MTTTETITRLRAALAPFAGAWNNTHRHLPDTTPDSNRQTVASEGVHAGHWKEAARVMRDTTHAAQPQEPRTRDEQAQQVIDALNALCLSMLRRRDRLDELIAESNRLIDTYNKEAGE